METDSRSITRLPLWLGMAAFVLYVATAARTIQWQDSAQFTYRVATANPENAYGLAMVHPLHYILGRAAATLFPRHLPWALSGVSALGGALAVGLTVACAQCLRCNTTTALFTGISLMLAHTFWRFSCLPEVYTLSAALMIAQVYLLLQSRQKNRPTPWVRIMALNGLALSNHNLALLTLAVWGIGFLLETRLRPKHWRLLPSMALAWILGSLPYSLLVLQEAIQTGEVLHTLHSALFGHGFRDEVSTLFPRPAYTVISLSFLALSFPGLTLPLACFSWKNRAGSRAALPPIMYGLAAFHLLFFLRYNVIDQYTFLIPVFPLLALMGGCGLEALRSIRFRKFAWICLCLQIPLYAIAPALARATGVLEPFARNKPFRDDATYLLWPWRVQDRSAHQLSKRALETAGPGGTVVVADPMARHSVLWMRWHMGQLDDIQLLSPHEHEDMLDVLHQQKRLVWVPLRSTDSPPAGWREVNGVWVAETNAKPPSTPL